MVPYIMSVSHCVFTLRSLYLFVRGRMAWADNTMGHLQCHCHRRSLARCLASHCWCVCDHAFVEKLCDVWMWCVCVPIRICDTCTCMKYQYRICSFKVKTYMETFEIWTIPYIFIWDIFVNICLCMYNIIHILTYCIYDIHHISIYQIYAHIVRKHMYICVISE